MSIIILTGGSGLIGSHLATMLNASGHTVRTLSRSTNSHHPDVYRWSPEERLIDKAVFDGAEYLVHLAGENTWTKPLSSKRMEAVRKSRIDSLAFLFETIKADNIPLKALVSASAIGYYRTIASEEPCVEEEAPASTFWGSLCKDWENEALRFQAAGIRTVVLRTALVLCAKGGFLPPLIKLTNLVGAVVMGNGKQHYPWIHLDDLCAIYQTALEQETLKGVFNAVAPDDQTNRSFNQSLAHHLNRPSLLPRIPSWCIKLVLGKRAVLLLEGRPVSSRKIQATGFRFAFPDLDAALKQEIPS